MTLITGPRCSDAVVLASDSQVTIEGGLKTTAQKLFRTPHGIIWGTTGPVAAAHAIAAQFDQLIMEGNPGRDTGRQGVEKVMLAAAADMKGPDGQLAGGLQEPGYGAVGSPSSQDLARFAFFGFASSRFLEYETLP